MTSTRVLSATLAAALALTACAITTVDGERLRPGEPEFADYVESVFRLQNEAATELAFALESAEFESALYLRLESAEETLLAACDGLNELASRRQRGEEDRNLGALREARNAPDCERAALAAIALRQDGGD
jgi:hypothetical protein